MPATSEQQEAPAEEQTQKTPMDLVSKVPTKIAKKRDGDVVVSKSRRQALGGAVTAIYLTPAGTYRVEGPAGEDWGVDFTKFGTALKVARNGPADEEPDGARVAARCDRSQHLRHHASGATCAIHRHRFRRAE